MKTILQSIILSILFITFSFANIINVPADQPTIQAGINAAANGDTVLVADSTYYENINYMGKAITVASHFLIDNDSTHIDSTIIDGSQPTNPDSGSVVYFHSGEDTSSVLCGFTITGGTGQNVFEPGSYDFRGGGGINFKNSGGRIISNKIINNTVTDDNMSIGGGIGAGFIGNEFWIILENNQIMNNSIDGINGAYGGGIFLAGNGRLVNNNISYNSCTATQSWAGGGGVETDASPSLPCTVTIKNNQINHNFVQGCSTATDPRAAFGGGIKVMRSKVSILNNEISFNQLNENSTGWGSGGGIYMYLADNGSVISGNKISNNKNEVTGTKYGGGIGLGQFNDLAITNNIIFRNSASHGGGISLTYNNAAIINNTIINNIASTNGGGLYLQNSQPVVINSILWDNQAVNGVGIYPSSLTKVRYSDVQGGYTGTGNINADPLFTDTLVYELSDISPCVGAGIDSIQVSNTWYYAPLFDYDGDPRPNTVDEFVDIGAQESDFINGIIKEESENLPTTFSLKQNYPNPFNPSTKIKYTISKSEKVKIVVYNLLGQKITTLLNKQMPSGSHEVEFTAKNLPSGVYLYRIETGDPSTGSPKGQAGQRFQEVRKMILLK